MSKRRTLIVAISGLVIATAEGRAGRHQDTIHARPLGILTVEHHGGDTRSGGYRADAGRRQRVRRGTPEFG